MYETPCPNCGRVAAASFIRPGAMIVCGGCEQRFQVQPDKILRKVQINDSALADLLELMPASTRTVATVSTDARVAEPAPVPIPPTGTPAGSGVATPPRPQPPPASPAPVSSRPAVRRPAAKARSPEAVTAESAPPPSDHTRRRAPWSTIYALGASVLVTAVLILALVLAALDGGHGGPNPTDTPLAFDPSLPVLTAQPLPLASWQAVDEPAGDLRTEHCPVQIIEERFVRPVGVGDYLLYQAQAVAQGPELIAQGTLQLTLLDAEGKAYARATQAIYLISPQVQVPVVVTLPGALRQNMALLTWKTTVDRVWAGAVPVEDAKVQPIGNGRRLQVRVKAFNPLTASMKDVVFVLTATEATGRIAGQWRVECDQVLGPRRSVEFVVLTPVDRSESLAWSIRGAGVPVAD